MISSVVLTGILKDNYKSHYRFIETHHNDPFDGQNDVVSLIPLAYWTKETDNVLFKTPKGTRVVIRGHLETAMDVGLYVVVEILEVE